MIEVAVGSRDSTNRERIRCIRCKKCHFAKDCPNVAAAEKEQSDQMQQVMQMEDQSMALTLFIEETYSSLTRAG